MIRLFFSKASPYARKIRILAIELALEQQITFIESHPFDNNSQLLNLNPLGKVPVLEVEGKCILDSEVICDYISSLSKLPVQQKTKNYWQHRTQQAMARGLLDVAVAWRREHMREDNIRSEFWEQRTLQASLRSLQWFDQRLDNIKLFPNITAITLACALDYFNFRHPQLFWEDQFSRLHMWLKEVQTRASMQATLPQ